MVEVEFRNVTITVSAETPEEAYTKLCEQLAANDSGIEWSTDTFITYAEPDHERSTEELFPKNVEEW